MDSKKYTGWGAKQETTRKKKAKEEGGREGGRKERRRKKSGKVKVEKEFILDTRK